MNRRHALNAFAASAAAFALPTIISKAYAAPGAADARFLFVFLRGGYDATNVVIPVGSSFYYESRPTLAIARPDVANNKAALALARADESVMWGLHPALKDSVYALWLRDQVAFVPFAGTDDLSRSHFETQDSIESGLPLNGGAGSGVDRASGFLNRLASTLGAQCAPVAFTDGLPVAMSGAVVVPNVTLKGNGRASFDDRQIAAFEKMYAGTPLQASIAEGFELRKAAAQQAQAMAASDAAEASSMSGAMQEMQMANRKALNAQSFELEARRMAGLMRDRFNLGFIDVGGWDTHVNEGAAQGTLATLLGNLGSGLGAFAREMGREWDRTTVVVLSEFGRTFRENGTRGTDHGHGTAAWVLGGSVRGGRIVGEQAAVERRTLNQDRDWPVLNEYRAMLGGIFKRMYGLDDARLAKVFPQARARDLGLV